MKNNVLKKLMIFGLACSMAVSGTPISAAAAGTEAQSETRQTEGETKAAETEKKQPGKRLERQTEKESETKAAEIPVKETEKETEKKEDVKQPETKGSAEEILEMPVVPRAEDGKLDITGGTLDTDYTYDESTGVITVKTNKALTISGKSGVEYTGRIVIEADEAKITMENVILKSSEGTVLTISESKKLQLTSILSNKLITDMTDTSAVEIAKGAELSVEGEGKLEITGNGIAKDITMSRGDAKEDETEPKDVPAALKIAEGTVMIKKGISFKGSDKKQKVSVQITGGNVEMATAEKAVIERDKMQLTGINNAAVYRTTLTLDEADSQVVSLAVKSGDGTYTYGGKGIYSNDNKQIFLYLPAKKTVVTADGAVYEGEVKQEDKTELLKEKAKLSIAPVVMEILSYGYAPEKIVPARVEITNASVNSTTVTAELIGENKDDFELKLPSDLTIPGKGSESVESTGITIRPKEKLAVGVYKAALKITDADGTELTSPITFTVNKAMLDPEVKISEKVYDGTRKAEGKVTVTGVYGEILKIDESKVVFTFNNANVKEAKSVTVKYLTFTEDDAKKNYELPAEMVVPASIRKAPNKKEKEDLKEPNVKAVYNSAKGVWEPQMDTYKGQEYLFFGSEATKLTDANKKSKNWVYGDKDTKKGRLVSLAQGSMKEGKVYTVWPRFAGDDNHEPSDGEVMTYAKFSIEQNGGGKTVKASDNQIKGLTEGTTYKTGSRIAFGAAGAGMSNTKPEPGDERYLPVSWKVSEKHDWSKAPYEAAFTINQAGSYTMQVTFKKQIWTKKAGEKGKWTDVSPAKTEVSKVSFKMAATGTNGTGYNTSTGASGSTTKTTATSTNTGKTVTAVKTGDFSPIMPMLILFLTSGVLLAGYGWKKRRVVK